MATKKFSTATGRELDKLSATRKQFAENVEALIKANGAKCVYFREVVTGYLGDNLAASNKKQADESKDEHTARINRIARAAFASIIEATEAAALVAAIAEQGEELARHNRGEIERAATTADNFATFAAKAAELSRADGRGELAADIEAAAYIYGEMAQATKLFGLFRECSPAIVRDGSVIFAREATIGTNRANLTEAEAAAMLAEVTAEGAPKYEILSLVGDNAADYIVRYGAAERIEKYLHTAAQYRRKLFGRVIDTTRAYIAEGGRYIKTMEASDKTKWRELSPILSDACQQANRERREENNKIAAKAKAERATAKRVAEFIATGAAIDASKLAADEAKAKAAKKMTATTSAKQLKKVQAKAKAAADIAAEAAALAATLKAEAAAEHITEAAEAAAMARATEAEQNAQAAAEAAAKVQAAAEAAARAIATAAAEATEAKATTTEAAA